MHVKKKKNLANAVDRKKQGGNYISLQEFEISNIVRLGLIKALPPTILIDEFRTGTDDEFGRRQEQWHQINAQYDQDDYGHKMTELGMMFLGICNLKKPHNK